MTVRQRSDSQGLRWNPVNHRTRKGNTVKKIVNLCILLAVLLLPLTVTTAVQAKPLATVPANFSVQLFFEGSGAVRWGIGKTHILTPGMTYRVAVAASLQTNAGYVIDTDSDSPWYGISPAETLVFNEIGDTGRLVLFTTHGMWIGGTYYSESRMISSPGI